MGGLKSSVDEHPTTPPTAVRVVLPHREPLSKSPVKCRSRPLPIDKRASPCHTPTRTSSAAETPRPRDQGATAEAPVAQRPRAFRLERLVLPVAVGSDAGSDHYRTDTTSRSGAVFETRRQLDNLRRPTPQSRVLWLTHHSWRNILVGRKDTLSRVHEQATARSRVCSRPFDGPEIVVDRFGSTQEGRVKNT